jgi:hypothetical protein
MARLLSSRPLHALFGKGSAPAERSIALPPPYLQPNNTQLSKNWKALSEDLTLQFGEKFGQGVVESPGLTFGEKFGQGVVE